VFIRGPFFAFRSPAQFGKLSLDTEVSHDQLSRPIV
jgi:hypothetical protein